MRYFEDVRVPWFKLHATVDCIPILHRLFRQWLVACTAPNRYLNLWWPLVIRTLKNILQWKNIVKLTNFHRRSAFKDYRLRFCHHFVWERSVKYRHNFLAILGGLLTDILKLSHIQQPKMVSAMTWCRQRISWIKLFRIVWRHMGSLGFRELSLDTYSIAQEIGTGFCCALLCCCYAIVHNEFTWSIYPYSSGLLCWHWGNR